MTERTDDKETPRGGGDVSGKSATPVPRGGGDVSGKALNTDQDTAPTDSEDNREMQKSATT